ncbi:MAG: hypothetical protein RL156_1777 [Bacteroidota bacterium]|jgi:hypothetical protein
MNDPALHVVRIGQISRKLRDLFAAMSLTAKQRDEIRELTQELRHCTDEINRWLDGKEVL